MTELADIPCRTFLGVPHASLEAAVEADEMAPTPDMWFEDPNAGRATLDGRRRRRAIMHCHVDCPSTARLACTLQGLQDGNLEDGIFGGYLPTERRQILTEAKRRGVDVKANLARMIEQSKRPAST